MNALLWWTGFVWWALLAVALGLALAAWIAEKVRGAERGSTANAEGRSPEVSRVPLARSSARATSGGDTPYTADSPQREPPPAPAPAPLVPILLRKGQVRPVGWPITGGSGLWSYEPAGLGSERMWHTESEDRGETVERLLAQNAEERPEEEAES